MKITKENKEKLLNENIKRIFVKDFISFFVYVKTDRIEIVGLEELSFKFTPKNFKKEYLEKIFSGINTIVSAVDNLSDFIIDFLDNDTLNFHGSILENYANVNKKYAK